MTVGAEPVEYVDPFTLRLDYGLVEFSWHRGQQSLPWKTARDAKLSPIHHRLAERRAYFKDVSGWEGPDWYAPPGEEPVVKALSWGRDPALADELAGWLRRKPDLGVAARTTRSKPGSISPLQ